jgi:hypothetical protein
VARSSDYRGRGTDGDPGLGGSGVSSCKPAFAIAAILIWVFFAAVLWFNSLRKPPKD